MKSSTFGGVQESAKCSEKHAKCVFGAPALEVGGCLAS